MRLLSSHLQKLEGVLEVYSSVIYKINQLSVNNKILFVKNYPALTLLITIG